MKNNFIAILFLAFVSYSFGQTPSSSPEKTRIRNFGSSLKKYEKKQKRKSNAQDEQKSDESPINDDETIRVQTDLVVSDILVTDQKSNVILGLKKDDFIVTEDNAPQTIEIFSSNENVTIPRSIVLVIDSAPSQFPYLKNSIEAAKILVDNLNTDDKMAIVTVDLKLQTDFTHDKAQLKKILDSIKPQSNYNAEFDTLLAVLNEMFEKQDNRPIIVFQTDGTEVIWLKPDKDIPYPVSYSTLYKSGARWTKQEYLPKFGFSDVREAIEKSKATIYSIIPGIKFLGFSKEEQSARAKISLTELHKSLGEKDSSLSATIKYYQSAEVERKMAAQTAMFKVAELSGGFAGFIEKPEDAQNIYLEIFTVIKNRYTIGYYPTNQNKVGKLRNVKIEVRGHPEYTITGRKAYFSE